MTPARAAYDGVAGVYDTLVVQESRAAWQAFFATWLRPGARVLDAGCGTGLDSAVALAAGGRVHGFDTSELMLRHARARAAPWGDAARFERGDLETYPASLERRSYDLVISGFAALNTCIDLAAFGAGCRRAVVPGGLVVVHFLTPGGLYDRLGHLTRGRIGEAFGPTSAREIEIRIGEAPVRHTLLSPSRMLGEAFGEGFELAAAMQTGMLTPDDGPTRLPTPLHRVLFRAEAAVRHSRRCLNLGRFSALALVVR